MKPQVDPVCFAQDQQPQAEAKNLMEFLCKDFEKPGLAAAPLAPAPASDNSLSWDILVTMRANEEKQPRPNYMACGSATPYAQTRRVLIQSAIQICERLELQNQTTFTACYLMDRLFQSKKFNHPKCQPDFPLFTMACIFIAAKYEEVEERVPSIDGLLDVCGFEYSAKSAACFRAIEIAVLKALDWRVSAITPLCFLRHYLVEMGLPTDSDDEYSEEDGEIEDAKKTSRSASVFDPTELRVMQRQATLLLGLALQHLEFTSFLPSQMAAAALLCAAFPQIASLQVSDLISFGGLSPDLRIVFEQVFGFSLEALTKAYGCLRNRYNEFLWIKASQQQQQQLQSHPPTVPVIPADMVVGPGVRPGYQTPPTLIPASEVDQLAGRLVVGCQMAESPNSNFDS